MGELETLLEAAKMLSEQDKEELIRQLSQSAPDPWVLGGADERYSAYNAYSNNIADLIAKIEVYAHDLPPFVGSLVEYLWHMLAVAAIESDPDSQKRIYESIGKYIIHIINELKMILVDLYLDTILGYRRTLSNFNHQAFVDATGKPVMKEVKDSINQIKSLRKKARRIRKTHFTTFVDNGISNVVVSCENVCEIEQIAQAMAIAENTIALCERFYAKIVANGYSEPPYKKVIAALPDLVSLGLTVYGFWVLIQKIFPVIFPK